MKADEIRAHRLRAEMAMRAPISTDAKALAQVVIRLCDELDQRASVAPPHQAADDSAGT